MKDIGIVRSPDDLGRIVIPAELRRKLNLTRGNEASIYYKEDKVYILSLVNKPKEEEYGMIKQVDKLGRLVIPASTRHKLGINKNVDLHFFTKNKMVILQKVGCIFCQNTKKIKNFNDYKICTNCIKEIKDNF